MIKGKISECEVTVSCQATHWLKYHSQDTSRTASSADVIYCPLRNGTASEGTDVQNPILFKTCMSGIILLLVDPQTICMHQPFDRQTEKEGRGN